MFSLFQGVKDYCHGCGRRLDSLNSMLIRLAQLAVNLDYGDADVISAVARTLRIPLDAIIACRVTRRAVDARKIRGGVRFILHVEAEIDESAAEKVSRTARTTGDIEIVAEQDESAQLQAAPHVAKAFASQPVVVGAGPAGLVAAWRLAAAGARPILIERGAPVEDRGRSVSRFWKRGELDAEDNVLFGEGGAGLFSDGKLNTRSKLRGHMQTVLRLLVECGAPESILVDAEPHLGSDRMTDIVLRLREKIIALGGEVKFSSRLDGVEIQDGRLAAVVVNSQRMETSRCVLATGHSARDVYRMLHSAGVALGAKPLAVGVRIEVPQKQIDRCQFGRSAGHPRLGAASFRLTQPPAGRARACYTFCMCPGGVVMACASSPGMLTTNGMSFAARDGAYGNAAFIVPVGPEDFGASAADPLAGVLWQAAIEAKAFSSGGDDYSLPACMLTDFLAGVVSASLPDDRSCRRSIPADIHKILPSYIGETLVAAVPAMMRKLNGVSIEEGIVYAAETRSSSPVRIVRDESLQSVSARGLYPAGEGAGYAGGIVTSAIDGLRAADAMLVENI